MRSLRSYVALAVRLGKDDSYRRWAGKLIDERSSALWERPEVVFEWSRFLARAAGRIPPTPREVGFSVSIEDRAKAGNHFLLSIANLGDGSARKIDDVPPRITNNFLSRERGQPYDERRTLFTSARVHGVR